MSIRSVLLTILLCLPAAAQISMPHAGLNGPPPKKVAAPAHPSATLTADEQKRLSEVIKHMKPKDRRKLAKALQQMTPQQRQQLLVSVKQQLAKPTPKAAQRGW